MVSLQAALLAFAVSAGASERVVSESVLLDFHADWCGPCQQVAPTVDRLAAQGYPVRKVNIDDERELAQKFQVQQIPCFVLVVGGREVKRVLGGVGLAEFHEMFRAAGVKPAGSRRAGAATRARAQSPDNPFDAFNGDSDRDSEAVEDAGGQSTFPSIASGPLGSAPRESYGGDAVAAHDAAPWESAPVDPGPLANPTPRTIHPNPAVSQPAASQPPTDAPADADRIVRRLLAASVRLRINDGAGNSVGSGTIIDAREGEALVLTCGHVFRESQGKGSISIDLFGDGAPHDLPGHLVSYDLQSDLGLVSFQPGVAVVAARVATADRVATGDRAMREGDAVINIGCNHGEHPTVRVSRVTAVNKFLGPPDIVVAGQPEQGRSGGGLFTTDGQLIGVCNFADPKDQAGVYRAVAAVHRELERMGLMEMCLERVDPASGNALALNAEPPAMPDRMPPPGRSPAASGLLPTSDAGGDAMALADTALSAALAESGQGAVPRASSELSPREAAALAELRRRGAGAEVICIVRSLSDPRAKSEIIVLDRASPAFLEQLSSERQVQQGRYLTSERRPNVAPRR